MFVLFGVYLLQLAVADDAVCYSQPLDEPIASRDGDFIIAGIFNIGRCPLKHSALPNTRVQGQNK